MRDSAMIHPLALVSPQAKIGTQVTIGPYTIVHDNVEIGEGSTIGSHCEIGVSNSLCDDSPLSIGAGAMIRSHSIFYQSTRIGAKLVTGHRVTIREKLSIGDNVQVGSMGELQGHGSIGNYVRMQSGVVIGQLCTVRDCAWLYVSVLLANDRRPPSNSLEGCEIGEFAVIGAHSMILPGVVVGRDSVVAAKSFVHRSVGERRLVRGNPARDIAPASVVKRVDDEQKSAYPWRFHFHRGYPQKLVDSWLLESEQIMGTSSIRPASDSLGRK